MNADVYIFNPDGGLNRQRLSCMTLVGSPFCEMLRFEMFVIMLGRTKVCHCLQFGSDAWVLYAGDIAGSKVTRFA